MNFQKTEKLFKYTFITFVILTVTVFLISKLYFKEKVDKPRIEMFEQILKGDIVQVTIYCSQEKFEGYKITITDKSIISELKKASTFDYGTKIYSGQYDQKYTIQLEMNDGKKYMYGFHKKFSPRGDYCRKNIEYEGKFYTNPYNDCGQMSIYENPQTTESDLINNNSYPSASVSGYNIKLIGFIEKYADNAPIDGKNKVPYYSRYELRELEKKNQGEKK